LAIRQKDLGNRLDKLERNLEGHLE
jgi:hypothetical protein